MSDAPGAPQPKAESPGGFAHVGECLYRHRSSGTYYGLIKKGGKQFRRSLKTKDRKLAERRIADLRLKVGGLTQTRDTAKTGFQTFATAWVERHRHHLKPSSFRRIVLCVSQLAAHFAETPVRSISRENCEDWAAKRGVNLSASSFNKERETLRSILEDARAQGMLLDNPAVGVRRRKMEKPEILIPTREQFSLLLSAMRALDSRAWPGADLVELLAYSGMRLAEATALTWGEVDFSRELFLVTGGERGTKNRETRTVPLFPALRDLLERLLGEAEPEAAARIIGIGDAKRAIDTACRNARLPHFHHHVFRHFFVSNAIERGVDFKTIAAWVGHKDGGVLVAKTYGHLRDTHSAEMAKRMTFGASHA